MFTGIIQDLGTVRGVARRGVNLLLTVETGLDLSGISTGDSVNVSGYCQTVVEVSARAFAVEVSPETVARTTAGSLRPGSRVNLELPLRLSDRLGGHLVLGHVDGVGQVVSVVREQGFSTFRIKVPDFMPRYMVEKGSVAVDGVSLTVNALGRDFFEVGIIPHTASRTTFGLLKPGDYVNIELDVLGKYVERLLGGKAPEGFDWESFAKHGFDGGK